MAEYSRKTKFYGIPVMGEGDVMTEEQNLIQMNMIDSLLYAAAYGCGTALFDEGQYSVVNDASENVTTFSITPMKERGFSLFGVVNYRLFYSTEMISKTLLNGTMYYIYAEPNFPSIDTDATAFSVIDYTTEQSLEDDGGNAVRIPLCVIDTTGDEPVIDLDVNKTYAKNVTAHISDNTNPHGIELVQQRLSVTESLQMKGMPLYGSYVTSFVTESTPHEIAPPSGREIAFVTAYAESEDAGYIWWKIQDGDAVIGNSGAEGVRVNVKLDLV